MKSDSAFWSFSVQLHDAALKPTKSPSQVDLTGWGLGAGWGVGGDPVYCCKSSSRMNPFNPEPAAMGPLYPGINTEQRPPPLAPPLPARQLTGSCADGAL